jgi:micrococcal nuclease
MTRLFFFAAIVAATLPVAFKTSAPAVSPPVLVRSVPDGDTIDVVGLGRIRLLGITAPPLDRRTGASATFALDARERLAGLVTNRWVRLEYEDGVAASYHAHSAYLFLETGEFVNALLAREGLARVSARGGLRRIEELRRAQADAQAARRGIWSGRPRP